MSQTKTQSMTEALVSTAVGFGMSIVLGLIVYPMFGHSFTVTQNIGITAIFTVASILRGYGLRRLFNHLHSVRP